MKNLFLFLGSVSAFFSVALGALGSHALKGRLSEYSLSVWQVGVQYQFYHALALCLVGLYCHKNKRCLAASGWLFFVGTLLFSGSLYLLAFGGPRWLGPITPIGGTCFLLGWLLLAVHAFKGEQKPV